MTATAQASEPLATPPLLHRRRRRPRRRLLLLLPALGLAAAATAWLWTGRLRDGNSAPTYSTTPASRTDVVSRVTATGTLEPVVQVEVGSQISGRIAELSADYNSMVKAGDVLAVIDPQLFESAVSQARAKLRAARADYKKAEAVRDNAVAEYQRAKSLDKIGAVPRAEVDAARASRRSAESQLESASAAITLAKAALDQAKANLTYTTIKSPIDGVVVSRNVDVGQTVAASLSAPTLFVIAEDLRRMEVHTSVAESDVGRLSPGMRVDFTVDAYPDQTFTGEVKQVRYEAETVSNVVTYDAVVRAKNEDLKLRPGMTANVSFILDAQRDVLAVPNKALLYRPAGARARMPARAGHDRAGRSKSAGERPRRRTVWVLESGQPRPVRVSVGISDGSFTQITGGDLEEGAQVITGDDAGAAAPRSGGSASPRGGRGRRGPPRIL